MYMYILYALLYVTTYKRPNGPFLSIINTNKKTKHKNGYTQKKRYWYGSVDLVLSEERKSAIDKKSTRFLALLSPIDED